MASFLSIFTPYLAAVKAVWGVIGWLWWFWLPLLLLFIFEKFVLSWRRNLFKKSEEWALFEIRIPREIKKNPKAMEQVFANLYGTRNEPGDWWEKYIDGEVTRWFSLEIVGFSGEIHFYIKTPKTHRKIVEANFYAQYPEIELVVLDEDYLNRLPKTIRELEEQDYNFWGTELILEKKDLFPIRTYQEFEGDVDEKSLDPVSAIMEVFNKLQQGENILVQILIRPAHTKWREEGLKVVEKMKAKFSKKGSVEVGAPATSFPFLTPGERIILEAIEKNLMKPAFETLIRYCYIAKKDIYKESFARRGIISAFNQYASFGLNRFRHNFNVYTRVKWIYFPYVFADGRAHNRMKRLWKNFQERKMPEENLTSQLLTSNFLNWNFASQAVILNIEELATLFHLPSYLVLTQPLIKRIESRKLAPPVGLPIFTEEKEIKL